jgi:hypothetical protein
MEYGTALKPTTKQATNNHDRKYEGPALITLPTYDEKTDGRAFVILFTHMADTYKWSAQQRLDRLTVSEG